MPDTSHFFTRVRGGVFYFRRFWPKTEVKGVCSPVIQAANLTHVGKISIPVIYKGFGTNTGLPKRA
jgi:hypothetical protein